MRGARVVLDLDGVLYDFEGLWQARAARLLGVHVPAVSTRKWDQMAEQLGLASNDQFWKWFRDTGGFEADGPLYPYAQELVASLAAHRYQVTVVTSRPEWAREQTYQLFLYRFASLPSLVFTEKKWEVPADVYFEDRPETLLSLSVNRPEATVIRVAQPWNDPDAATDRPLGMGDMPWVEGPLGVGQAMGLPGVFRG